MGNTPSTLPSVSTPTPLSSVYTLPSTLYSPSLPSYNGIVCGTECANCQQQAKSIYDSCVSSASTTNTRCCSTGQSCCSDGSYALGTKICSNNRMRALQSCVTTYQSTPCQKTSVSINKCELGCYANQAIYPSILCFDSVAVKACKNLCNSVTSVARSGDFCSKNIVQIGECDQGCCFASTANGIGSKSQQFINTVTADVNKCSAKCQASLPADFDYHNNSGCRSTCASQQTACYAKAANVNPACAAAYTRCINACPITYYAPGRRLSGA